MLKLEHINFEFKPTTLVLVTTYQCTAKCTNCCFQASPEKRGAINVNDSYDIIDEAKKYFPNISLFVLTGGEPFLLKIDNLIKIISYAKSQGLHTRIVSNCFWASSSAKAKEYIKELAASGLNELNISTGDEYLQYVKLDNIITACIESVKENIVTVINIESTLESKMNQKKLEEHLGFKEFFEDEKNRKLLKIINGAWVEFDSNNKKKNEKSLKQNRIDEKTGCNSIFDTITVFPDKSVKSCCGLTVNNIDEFNLGNFNYDNLINLYNRQFDNFINIWIKIEGPQKIFDYLIKQNHTLNK